MKYSTIIARVSLLAGSSAAEYVWPDKNDQIEDVYMLQGGFNRMGFIDGILSCGFGQSEPGRQNTAEWIRTAYHDMATADVEAGTGGLDASIMFETERGENKGSAFNNTFGHFLNFYTSRSSAADLVALGVVGSMAVCNGYQIPFRAGRIDATEAGPMGVPEPQEDLATHTAKFAKQGFSKTEMIELVACGHSLGGVHGANFPEITHDNSTGQVSHFEYGYSNEQFDNVVVHEYLASNTSNLLVAGSNDTLNSDKRIFGADNNVTMEALADSTHFQERCQDVMGRMIDTVPRDVVLSEPIKPIDIKPYINLLSLNQNGTIDFSGYIRVHYGGDSGRPNASDISVFLSYKDRAGNVVNDTISAQRPRWQNGIGTGFNQVNFVFFEWNTQLDPSAGISSFDVHVTTKSTGKTEVHNNVGNGYPVQDTLLYQIKQSCISISPKEGGGSEGHLTVVAAVRSEAASGAQLDMHFVKKVARPGVMFPRFEVQVEPFQAMEKTLSGYSLFEVKDMVIDEKSLSTTLDLVLSGGNKDARVEFQKTGSLTSQNCELL
ncbi:heme peroxidase [Periconia macrospinosa]|uniref:Peroxidase n=1 Tax=Periconia macrospinosa TaxID=97972 RepID=A0A2V1E127_9PLEO|nr:heme peroxidase [Periconia macrospinosa]